MIDIRAFRGCPIKDLALPEGTKVLDIDEYDRRNNPQRYNYAARHRDDYVDIERETWDALTDGQYGDYPGYEIDYDSIGF